MNLLAFFMRTKELAFTFIVMFFLSGHIPLVESFPEHPQYFQNYFKKFDKYFKENFGDVSEAQSRLKFQEKMEKVKHWRSQKEQKRFSWNIIYNIKTEGLSYSFSMEGLIPKLVGSKNLTKSLKDFPLTYKGQFIFSDFVKGAKFLKNSKGEIVQVEYELNNVQAEWLPEKLKKAVYKMGYDTRLPLDKIGITNNGEIYARYP
ncbi:MAG: hypothetical protein NXH75_07540 [Halobacteriovoraceae bacterium]|nr:hypothetical protein [Halobacteriovoraceae bacterium]